MEHIPDGDIGGRLRRAREQRGLSLSDVAKLTKLSVHTLQAIERNDFASLPRGIFRKAYVRTLAAEVGLDPNEIATQYCERFEPRVETVTLPNRETALEQQWLQQLTPSPRRSVVTLAAMAALAVAWFMLQPGPAGAKVPLEHAASESDAMAFAPGASIALAADARDAATPIETAAPAAALPLRIEMAAADWCWVAAEADDERVMYRLVKPGERVVLEGQRTIALRLGNAGAVTLSINDGPRRSLGRDGQVIQLEVTPDNVESLRDGAAPTRNNALRVLG